MTQSELEEIARLGRENHRLSMENQHLQEWADESDAHSVSNATLLFVSVASIFMGFAIAMLWR